MTWSPATLAREIRREFAEAQRRRALVTVAEEEAEPLGPRHEPAVKTRRRIVERRVET